MGEHAQEETMSPKKATQNSTKSTTATGKKSKAFTPDLSPKTWYGMPAYAKDGKVVCFFQSAKKFNSRYATLGFSDKANLDEGAMWPTSFALKELTATEEAKIGALVKRAAG